MHAVQLATQEDDARLDRERRVISRSLQKLLVPGPDFHLTTALDIDRRQVESFIAAKFRDCHGAQIISFLPALLNIQCCGKLSAALGINPARQGPLFLEQYLDQPAEQAIAGIAKTPVSRHSIVEIGNLVSTVNGATALLYLVLLAVIHRAGHHWVMFTATPEVQRSIEKLGFKIAPVCAADPSRLANPAQWGSYYDVKPQVMVGFIGDSYQACLDNRLLESVLLLTEAKISALAEKFSGL